MRMKAAIGGTCAVVAIMAAAATALDTHYGLGLRPVEYLHFPIAVIIPVAGVWAVFTAHRRRFLVEHLVRLIPWSPVTVGSVIGLCILLPLATASFMRYARVIAPFPSGISVGLQVYEGGLDLAYWFSQSGYGAPGAGITISAVGSWSRNAVRNDFLATWATPRDGVFDAGHEAITWPAPASVTHLSFPLWLPGIVLTLAPARSFLAARRAHGVSGDVICLRCGYNLRGNTSGVCPECGTAIRNAETQKNRNAETS